MNISIKKIGYKHGTCGWVADKLNSGELLLSESNSFYLPPWSGGHPGTTTHGLVLSDKHGNSALIAYRAPDGYHYNTTAPFKDDQFAHWTLSLTAAARASLAKIAAQWCAEQVEI